MLTYGLCQHHVTNARLMVRTGQFKHDTMLKFLKVVYEGRKLIHDSLHDEDSKHVPDNL